VQHQSHAALAQLAHNLIAGDGGQALVQ
jgi:hypothetical protein